MALLVIEGFDSAHLPTFVTNGATGSYQASRTPGQVGGTSFQAQGNSGSTANVNLTHTNLASGGGGCGFYFDFTTAFTSQQFFQLREGTTRHLGIRLNSSTPTTLELVGPAGTVVATASNIDLQYAAWYHLGWEYTIADSGGRIRFWLNEQPIIDYTGDTRNGGTGVVNSNYFQSNAASSNLVRVDDWYVYDLTGSAPWNVQMGDLVVETLRPTGQGTHNAWGGSDGNSINNWDLIDDLNGTTDFISTSASAAKDTSILADLPAAANNVYGIVVEALVSKADSGTAPGIHDLVRDGLGNELAAEIVSQANLSTSWIWQRAQVRTTKPSGGSWTISEINGMEVGVRTP